MIAVFLFIFDQSKCYITHKNGGRVNWMITVTPHLDVHLNNKSFVSKDILCLTRDEQFLSIENVQFRVFSNFPGLDLY